MRLLKKAVEKEHLYYHLLSGVDLPIKTQNQIHDFFNKNAGSEFIRLDPNTEKNNYIEDRIKYYHVFQEKIGRNRGICIALLTKVEQGLLYIQKCMGINRLKKQNIQYYKGTNWFSITHELAKYILDNECIIQKICKWSLCADEIFLQTLVMNSCFRERVANKSLRYIDWKRGNPYVFKEQDYELLINNENLFARKFDYQEDSRIVNRIYDYIRKDE